MPNPTCRVPRGRADRNSAGGGSRLAAVLSRPARARGSKPFLARAAHPASTSRPARARGSKRGTAGPATLARGVASRAGARIETACCAASWCRRRRRVPRGRADRNVSVEVEVLDTNRRVPRGRADRNEYVREHELRPDGRVPRGRADRNSAGTVAASICSRRVPRGRADRNAHEVDHVVCRHRRVPRGRADRNKRGSALRAGIVVASRAGARIETVATRRRPAISMSRPARARGSKLGVGRVGPDGRACRVPRGRADRNEGFCNQAKAQESRVPRGRADRNTGSAPGRRGCRMSRPARARGSKPDRPRCVSGTERSRPARARGSKPRAVGCGDDGRMSRPARARGSKQFQPGRTCWSGRGRVPRGRADRNVDMARPSMEREVASRAGARIETGAYKEIGGHAGVASRAGARIEKTNRSLALPAMMSRPARARGSKLREFPAYQDAARRVPRGRADRNLGTHTAILAS